MALPEGKEVYSTQTRLSVLTPNNRCEMSNLAPCTHEEADTRLMIHALDAPLRGHRRIKIRTNDTDVIVLFLSVVSTRLVDELPPTKAVLEQHIRRPVLQEAHTWGQTLLCQPPLPGPADWGWQRQARRWSPYWTTLKKAKDTCYELIHCGCKLHAGGDASV